MDAKKVASLRKAVEVMMSRSMSARDSADYRRSWEYWAAMHAYFGTGTKSGTAEDFARRPGRAGFAGQPNLTLPPSPAGVARDVWDKCEHGTPHFVTWHRMYLHFFEQVLREAAQDPTLSLPYWDYTDPKQGALPEIFRDEFLDPQRTVRNPLYTSLRTPGLNGGLVEVAAQARTAHSALQNSEFFKRTAPAGQPDPRDSFSELLEVEPHGNIHCAVGSACSGPLMGSVPTSARDPIFYLHHANIDRLWTCWSKHWGQNANPVGDKNWMDKTFDFIDAQGAKASMAVRELFDPNGPVKVVYDRETNCSPEPLPQPAMAVARHQGKTSATLRPLSASSQPVAITGRPQRVPLAVHPQAGATLQSMEKFSVDSPREVLLRLTGVSARTPPGVLLTVYLSDAESTERRQLVGSLSFFGDFDGHAGHGAAERSYVLPASKAAANLLAQGTPLSRIQVLLVPGLGVTGRTEDQVAAQFSKESELRIRRVDLVVRQRLGLLQK